MSFGNQSEKLRKIIIGAGTFLFVSIVFSSVYLSFFYDNVSRSLMEANRQLSLGNKDAAYDIYFSIIGKDTSCEEAYRALAKLAAERGNFKDCAYFWKSVSNLNPLDNNAKLEYFRSMIISGAISHLKYRYESLADDSFLGDAERFEIAKAFLRNRMEHEAFTVSDKIASSTYKNLFSAHYNYSKGNFSEARKKYIEALADAKTPDENAYARLGLAVCDADANPLAAKELVDTISTENPAILAELLEVKAALSELSGDSEGAAKAYLGLAKARRYQIAPIVKCAELAFETKSKKILSELNASFESKDKISLELSYFVSAMEAVLDGDMATAQKRLNLSGIFSKTLSGRILELEILSSTKNFAALSRAAVDFSSNIKSIPETKLNKVVGILEKALDGNRADKNLLDALLKISPENGLANLVKMRSAFADGRFSEAFIAASIVSEIPNISAAAFSIACMSAMNLKNYTTVSVLAKKRLSKNRDDSEAALFAAKAAVASGNTDEAEFYYRKVLKTRQLSPDLTEEIGKFFLAAKKYEAFDTLINSIDTKNLPENEAVKAALSALYEKRRGNVGKQIALLKHASDLQPQSVGLKLELAQAYADSGDFRAAIAFLESDTALSEIPQGRLMLSVFLREENGKELARSVEILEKLNSSHPQNAVLLTELSKSLFKCGKKPDALERAREAAVASPNNADALFQLGYMLSENGKYAEAILPLEKSYGLNPEERVKKLLMRSLLNAEKEASNISEKILFLRKSAGLSPDDKAIAERLKLAERDFAKGRK
ncbi:MAG: tetratricopeptide repeat protein [Candidatus Merdousia sp.]|nr:tetratricopeptide repeat protein [Candidatus Merdousia sp.]